VLGFASEELWRSCKASAIVSSPHAVMDPFVTVAAEDAGDRLIGVCVTDAVRRMSATIVQTAMTLDHLTPGRVVIGPGSGKPMNYRPFGWDVPSPLRRLTEAARSMRHYLDHTRPDERGGIIAIRPPGGSAGPRLWISAHGPKAQQVAGQYGDGWLCARRQRGILARGLAERRAGGPRGWPRPDPDHSRRVRLGRRARRSRRGTRRA
jgi:alkanesulfonate monooxygenase SsuD/methylene tetrahydromethanopterin reductase-like flavin-dependent oxidoreductase (luciferase family)